MTIATTVMTMKRIQSKNQHRQKDKNYCQNDIN